MWGLKHKPRAGAEAWHLPTCPNLMSSSPAVPPPITVHTGGEAGPTLWQDLYVRYVLGRLSVDGTGTGLREEV